jgi:hypothetical protein
VDLYRVFDWDGSSLGRGEGGPLHVPRALQGRGRHDNPAAYGAWYWSRDSLSPIAEWLQVYRGGTVDDDDFVGPADRVRAVVGIEIDDGIRLVYLDAPAELTRRTLRPSQVATSDRATTQRIAASLFREGAAGFSWWSTLEASWINLTLFYERALPHVRVTAAPRPLSTRDPQVREAAARLDIDLER